MSHNHTHSCTCSHASVKFCKHCNACYCLDCNQEWPTRSTWTYQGYPWYSTYTNIQGTQAQMQSGGGVTNTIGLATSCKHEA